MLCILFCCVSVIALANAEFPTTSTQIKQYAELQDMQWEESLNDKQIEILKSAAASDSGPVVIEAVKVIAIHRITDFIPQLEKGVGRNNSLGMKLGKTIAEILKKDKELHVGDLLNLIPSELAYDYSDSPSYEELIASIAVIDICRGLRKSCMDKYKRKKRMGNVL